MRANRFARPILAVCLIGVAAGVVWAVRWARSPGPVDVQLIRAQAERYHAEGNLSALAAVLGGVPDTAPEKPIALLEQARAYWELSRGLELEATVAKLESLDPYPELPSPQTMSAWATLVDHLLGHERFEEARQVLWKLHRAYLRRGRPTHFPLFMMLRTRYESVTPSLAVERLRQFVQDAPTDYDSHRALGIYLGRQGDLSEARERLEYAVQARPNVARFQESWLDLLFASRDSEDAEIALAKLPASLGDRPEFWVFKGRAHENRQDWPQAVACYRKAVKLEPSRLDANNLLCQALRRAGHEQESAEVLARSKVLSEAYHGLSKIYHLHRISKARPDAKTQQRISELCATLGWQDEAEAWRTLP